MTAQTAATGRATAAADSARARRAGGKRCLPRLGPADGVIEVGVGGQAADEAVEPAEYDLPATQIADPGGFESQLAQSREQRRSGNVDQVAGQIEGEPALAEGSRLKARRVRHRDYDHAAGRKEPRRALELANRLRAGARASARTRSPRSGPSKSASAASRTSGPVRMALEPDRIPPDGGERVEQRPVARPHVQDRPRAERSGRGDGRAGRAARAARDPRTPRSARPPAGTRTRTRARARRRWASARSFAPRRHRRARSGSRHGQSVPAPRRTSRRRRMPRRRWAPAAARSRTRGS